MREIAGLTTPQTAVGQCVNDSSGSSSTALNNPYGLAFSADGLLFISESGTGHNNVFGFNSGTNSLALIAGLATGASGPYNVSQEGQAASLVPLNQPLGVTTDTGGSIYLADSQNNIVRKLGANLAFPPTNVGSTSASQTIVFSINQTVNLTLSVGTDFNLVSATCSGPLTHSANPICQVVLTFSPSRPGYRYSALELKDSISGKLISVELQGLGLGPLSLLAPGVASTRASSLRTAIAVSTDSAGDAYVLERGNGSSTADVLFYPAAGGAAQVVVAQGAGMVSPTAMAVDGAGNIFIADSGVGGIGGGNIIRFGADGSVNTSYATGLPGVTAMAVDGFDDLFLAIGGSFHNVTEIYAGGQRRVVAGSGAVADANNVVATSAVFSGPSAVALGLNGIAVADAGTHYVYLIDNSGIIHIVAGNGATSTTSPGVATGTGLLTPDGLAIDAAGDIYIADNTANIVYAVYSVISNGTNIYPVIGTGAPGYTGDHGPSTAATINAPLAIALDGSSDLFVVDSGNNALREVSYPVTSTIGFGNVLIGTTSAPGVQYLANAGNANLTFTADYPITTTDTVHYQVSASPTTTCFNPVVSGGVCDIGYTFTPTVAGPAPAGQSNLISNSYNSQQTVIFSTSGSGGYSTGPLPFTLLSETEVYGFSFSESFTFTGSLPASGTMVFYIGAQTLCTSTITNASAGTITCNALPSGLAVGSYTVSFTFTSTNSYYSSVTGTTTLNVTKEPLTVNVNSYTRQYGAPNPTCGWQISGVVNNNVINVTCSISATTLSPVGAVSHHRECHRRKHRRLQRNHQYRHADHHAVDDAPDHYGEQRHPSLRHSQPALLQHHHWPGSRRHLQHHLLNVGHDNIAGRELRHQRKPLGREPEQLLEHSGCLRYVVDYTGNDGPGRLMQQRQQAVRHCQSNIRLCDQRTAQWRQRDGHLLDRGDDRLSHRQLRDHSVHLRPGRGQLQPDRGPGHADHHAHVDAAVHYGE